MGTDLGDFGIGAPDWVAATRVGIRLLVAVALGGVIGWERERRGRAAGFRTHMLIALGVALFTAVTEGLAVDSSEMADLVRGIAPGIGFLGAGAILKMSDRREIRGLTTAAGIWSTAAIAFAVGAGWITVSVFAAALAWFILHVVARIDAAIGSRPPTDGDTLQQEP